MVAFCAIYTVQSILRSTSLFLSDWTLFRLATLQELVYELEKQAETRYPPLRVDDMNAPDAMARQISRGVQVVLQKKKARHVLASGRTGTSQLPITTDTGAFDNPFNDSLVGLQIPQFDDLSNFFSNTDSMANLSTTMDWEFERLLQTSVTPAREPETRWESTGSLGHLDSQFMAFNSYNSS
jgi:hypothetical protein